MDETGAADLGIEGLEDPQEIGVGGFATVYKAFQPAFRRTVAVKILAAVNLDDATKSRFERECQAMGSLSEHPNIVTVYGAGFTTVHGTRPYMIMAYLPGGSLEDRIKGKEPLRWEEASLIGVHLSGALETAHRGDIIHRDIKPANVLMSGYGDAQLTDFGIARVAGGHETQSGVITASMAHAPPEVLDGDKPSVSGDVYSLGSTIFELLYGTPAFEVDGDESMVPMLRRILTADPPDLRERGVPDAICEVIEKSMSKDPAVRQKSALAFGREMQAARRKIGLDPGKLTIPAGLIDLEEDPEADLTFTDSPSAMVEAATAAAAVPTPSLASQTTTLTRGPSGEPILTDAQRAAGVSVIEVEKKRGAGLFVALGAFVLLVAVVLGVVIVSATRKSETATSTTTTEPTDYTDKDARDFVQECADKPGISQNYCRCVYDEVKLRVPYERFKQLKGESDARQNEFFQSAELRGVLLDCKRKTGVRPDPGGPPGTG